MKRTIKIHPNDNVAVALVPLSANETIEFENESVVLKEDIKQGHKFSLKPIQKDENVIKYGDPIGHATKDIEEGCHVHVHNVKTNLSDMLEYSYRPQLAEMKKDGHRTFMGYLRKNGEAGIRNEIWIIPTVGCVNSVVKKVESKAQHLVGGSVEAVVAFNHPYGCSQMGDDQDNTRQVLADLIVHPNAGGVVVLGLGCENSNIAEVKKHLPENYDTERIRFIVAQEHEDEIEECLKHVNELAELMKNDKREEIGAEKLVIGMKCGGSDGLSGITANPTVGRFSDLLIACGGTTILTEVPEMFGAETLLMNRCENTELFDKTVHLINDFKQYFMNHNQTIYENPSPGNKEGGITTLEDKSLGCTQKSGAANVQGVLAYAERVSVPGLNLLSAPGNDLVASTALAASGCQMVLFTTGRGTPFATAVPTLKIASNTALYEKKKKWIDFNAGRAVEDLSIDECGEELFQLVLDTASGKKAKSEEDGYHDIAIFKQGVTL